MTTSSPRSSKLLIRLLLALIVLFGVVLILNYSGALKITEVQGSDMLPAFGKGDKVWSISSSSPSRGDMVLYTINGEEKYGRVAALGNDTLFMMNGELEVNGKISSSEKKVWNSYYIDAQQAGSLKDLLTESSRNSRMAPWLDEDGIERAQVIDFSQEEAAKFSGMVSFYEGSFRSLWQPTNKFWNLRVYGPVVIPPNTYFILGDNRGHAHDSRFHGPVTEDAIAGIVHTMPW